MHDDRKRSASLNVDTGDWYCHACDFGSNVEHLVTLVKGGRGSYSPNGTGAAEREEDRRTSSPPTISEGTVGGWHSALLGNKLKLKALMERRGLEVETLKTFQVGWNAAQSAYTIPIRDAKGAICNVRHYTLDTADDRRKIWSIEGMGAPVLFPIAQLDDHSEIIVCEGEWDAMVAIQHGFPAVTRTGAAKVWKPTWNHLFDDKLVYVCHDMDHAGQAGNDRVEKELKGHAREIRRIMLPYEVTEKHGKDITDFFFEYTDVDFKELLFGTEGTKRDPAVVERQLQEINVLDSFDANRAGEKIRMRVTVVGKRTPTFHLPRDVEFTCNQSAGAKCQVCPMNDMEGKATRHIEAHDPVVLEMMNASNLQLKDVLRRVVGAQKCAMLQHEVVEYRSVEELIVRPSVDRESTGKSGDYTTRRVISVGRHDSLANNTVDVVGTIYPAPKTQHNEFQAWEVTKTETSLDRYEVTPEAVRLMQRFKPKPGQRPLKKLGDIARDLSLHVTKIYGRNEMHALFDLVFHSILQFEFGGQMLQRGWLEGLVVGDTRTGKSEAAERLIQHYGHGELVTCEATSFAGVIGGVQQHGNDKIWDVTWGLIPINDRRLVVLDEVSGLQTDQIASMSSVRSSGEAQITKIKSERTYARTRLLWLSNPRQGRLSDYTYGVQAILPLIGNNEDVARFDIAMSVAANEVDPAVINANHGELGRPVYPQAALREMLVWCWSRKAEDVIWLDGVQQAVYDAALDVGSRYADTPPLIQAANVRIKIARMAVALAARTFSTDETYEHVVVKKEHVEDAVKFMDLLYTMPGFGYGEVSAERLRDVDEANKNYDNAKEYLWQTKGLAKFLRGMGGRFRSNDIQDMMNLDRDLANAIVNTLWNFRMISRRGPEILINPQLHDLLREIKD